MSAPEPGAGPVVGPAFARVMAAYNAEMNRRVYAAAATLTEAQRRQDRGAFWGSIHGTLAHVLWADRLWLFRFGAGADPGLPLRDSATWIEAWPTLAAERRVTDARLAEWADGLAADDLSGDLAWFSGAKQRDMATPRALVVAHIFNRQTHHRGQVHALLTASGAATGDTDLPFVL